MMDGRGKSDIPIVPGKPSNNSEQSAAEVVEGRGVTKGNPLGQNARRTQSRVNASSALERVRVAARRDRRQRFTALLHHVYDIDRLRAAYYALQRHAAPGVDGETWQPYGEELEKNLQELSERLRRGAYRAKPVRRVYIAKTDGSQRPLGVPALEDKIVQRAVVEVLNAIYETDFLGMSYGFRSGRSPHRALDALDHGWLVKFIEHRVADRRVVHLIQKWLKAGVLEDGTRTRREAGTVQGGSISPLLANIYLHYVFDLWVRQWRRKQAHGEVIVVRFADDFVLGFQYRKEAERFLAELRERLARFNLELHPDKTRLIEFGRFAIENRRRRAAGKPESFDFLGFTHSCTITRVGGWYAVRRQTMRKRMRAKLRDVKETLRRRMHDPVPAQGKYLAAVMRGYSRYYGVPGNSHALQAFRAVLVRHWWRTLNRRSQGRHVSWSRIWRLFNRWVPHARICHPYPSERLQVNT